MNTRRHPLTACLAAGTLAGLLLSCANTVLIRPIEPGTSLVAPSGHGLVFGRIAVIRDSEDQLAALPAFPKEFGWVLQELKTGRKYVVDSLTQNGPFVLDLQGGSYEVTKLMYEERAGLWEGRLPASFSVKPGQLVYLGTWQITFTNLGPSSKISGGVANQLKEASDDLKQNYEGKLQPITQGLMESALQGYFSLIRPRAEQ